MRDGWSLGGLVGTGSGNAVGFRAWEGRWACSMEMPSYE